jgi:hypothetical protein
MLPLSFGLSLQDAKVKQNAYALIELLDRAKDFLEHRS